DARGPAVLRADHRGARDAGRRPRPARSRRRGALLTSRLKDWLPALGVFVLGIALWQGLTAAFHVQTFLLPKPSDIATSFWDNKSPLWHAGVYTLKEAVGGFAIGAGLGVLSALLLARFRNVGAALMPFAIELMRSYGGGEIATFRRVRIPSSLPFMFTGLKIAAVLSMIGAIVGEYFGGPTNALGVSILNDSQLFDFARAWAGIALASAFGIGLYAAVALVEHLTTGWHPSARAASTE